MAIELDDITAILPAGNQSRKTRRFLKSPPENVRLILIDASEDSTHDIVKSTGPHYTTVTRHGGVYGSPEPWGRNGYDTLASLY